MYVIHETKLTKSFKTVDNKLLEIGDQIFLKGSDSEDDTDAPMHGIT